MDRGGLTGYSSPTTSDLLRLLSSLLKHKLVLPQSGC
jgi:hypothetical protein